MLFKFPLERLGASIDIDCHEGVWAGRFRNHGNNGREQIKREKSRSFFGGRHGNDKKIIDGKRGTKTLMNRQIMRRYHGLYFDAEDIYYRHVPREVWVVPHGF